MPSLSVARVVERERKESLESILRRAAEDRKSPEQIANDLGVTVQTLSNYLRPLGGRVIRTIWLPCDGDE